MKIREYSYLLFIAFGLVVFAACESEIDTTIVDLPSQDPIQFEEYIFLITLAGDTVLITDQLNASNNSYEIDSSYYTYNTTWEYFEDTIYAEDNQQIDTIITDSIEVVDSILVEDTYSVLQVSLHLTPSAFYQLDSTMIMNLSTSSSRPNGILYYAPEDYELSNKGVLLIDRLDGIYFAYLNFYVTQMPVGNTKYLDLEVFSGGLIKSNQLISYIQNNTAIDYNNWDTFDVPQEMFIHGKIRLKVED